MTLVTSSKKLWTAPDKWTRLKVHAPWFCAFSRYPTQRLVPSLVPVISGPQCLLFNKGPLQLSASHRHKAPPPTCPLWNVLAAPSFSELLHGRSLYRVRLMGEVVISHSVHTSSCPWRPVHRKTAWHVFLTRLAKQELFHFTRFNYLPLCVKRHHQMLYLCSP